MSSVAFTTLGCRLNQAESDAMAEDLAAAGVGPVAADESPDLVVINTCTVTREATKASRQAIRRAVRKHPGAKVVVIGCYAVSDRAAIEAIEGVDAVLGNDEKEFFTAALASSSTTAPLLDIGFRSKVAPESAPTRVRANLKAQTGCDEWCSFCIIPTTRGPLRSMDEDALVREGTARVEAGARELVLTGVHLGKYAYDRGGDESSLVRLFSRLLDIDGLFRLRLSSILSAHLTDEVLDFMASEPRMCRYLHVPLQSGDDRILAAMNRPYRIADYVERVQAARAALEGLALATDIIVGYPGEDDAAFRATMAVTERIGFSKLHVFRYSPRDGTASAALEDPVLPDVKRARSKALIGLGKAIRERFLADHLTATLDVLVEDERVVDGVSVASGQTDDHVRVWFEGSGMLGRIVEVQPEEVRSDGIRGRAVYSTRGSAALIDTGRQR